MRSTDDRATPTQRCLRIKSIAWFILSLFKSIRLLQRTFRRTANHARRDFAKTSTEAWPVRRHCFLDKSGIRPLASNISPFIGSTAARRMATMVPPLPRNPVVLLPPTLVDVLFHPPVGSSVEPITRQFQFSLHAPPRAFLRELKLIFPAMGPGTLEALAVLCVYQPTTNDLVTSDPVVNRERDLCLEQVRSVFNKLADVTRPSGSFFDYADPPSGMPAFSQAGPALFPDVDSHNRLLKYPITHIGTCALVAHPTWSTNCYPSTGFVGPEGVEAVKEWIEQAREGKERVEMCRGLVEMLEDEARVGRAG